MNGWMLAGFAVVMAAFCWEIARVIRQIKREGKRDE